MTDRTINPLRIAVDFDGTIVEHAFPDLGPLVPGSIQVFKNLQEHGHEVGLWTCRSGIYLEHAVEMLRGHGVHPAFVNVDPQLPPGSLWQGDASIRPVHVGPKLAFDLCIDDRNLGCPLRQAPSPFSKWVVDWEAVQNDLARRGVLHPEKLVRW